MYWDLPICHAILSKRIFALYLLTSTSLIHIRVGRRDDGRMHSVSDSRESARATRPYGTNPFSRLDTRGCVTTVNREKTQVNNALKRFRSEEHTSELQS